MWNKGWSSNISTSLKPNDVVGVKDLIETSLDDDKAEDIVTLEISKKCSFADFMVVATGRSQRHVSSCAQHIVEKLKDAGSPAISVEGMESGDWVLIDAGDVVVHLFRPEIRDFYNLEKMWAVPVPSSEEMAAV